MIHRILSHTCRHGGLYAFFMVYPTVVHEFILRIFFFFFFFFFFFVRIRSQRKPHSRFGTNVVHQGVGVFSEFYSTCIHSCLLHISRSDAPIVPRCCRLGQCEWSPDTESAVRASSEGHRAVLNAFNIARLVRSFGRFFHRGMMHGNQSRPITVTMAT